MGRTRESANLVSDRNIFVDIANDLVGIGTTAPTATLEVSGTLAVSGVSTHTSTVEITPSSDVQGLIIDGSNIDSENRAHLTLKGGGPQVIDFRDNGGGQGIRISYRTTPNEWRLENSESSTYYYIVADRDDGRVDLYHDGDKRLETTGAGVTVYGTTQTQQLNVSGVSTFQGNVTMSGDLTVNGTTTTLDTNLQEVDLINVQANASVPAIGVTQSGAGNVAKFYNGSGAVFTIANGGNVTVESGTLTLNNNLDMQDDDKILLGTGDDIQIWHSGTYSNIKNDTGQLRVRSDDLRLQNNAANENYITCTANGAVELYYDNSKKFETGQYGAIITGSLAASNIDLEDDAKLLLGTGDDLQIYHDGSNSYIKDVGTGILQINTNYFQVKNADDDEFIIQASQNGAVSLRFDNSEKFATTGGGISVTGVCTATSFSGDGANLTNVPTGFSPINFVLS